MSRFTRGLYTTGNLFLPLREVGRTINAVLRSLTRAGVVTAEAATTGLREARLGVQGNPGVARGMPTQWWAGIATAAIGVLCFAALWPATGVLSKVTLVVLGVAFTGTGALIAGAAAFACQRSRQRVDSWQAWVRQPRLWTPY